MRRIYLISIILLLFNIKWSGAQETSIIISEPVSSQDPRIEDGAIEARDLIKLTGTFTYSSATNKDLTFKSNPDLICSASYLYSPVTGSSRKLNTQLEVGTLPGSINVSPTGAAIYTIPVEVPPGTAGMQPNLSIVYNSQQGRSKLGKGFNIAGLSVITKIPQGNYYDGQVTGLGRWLYDRLALDGNRLILVDGDYGLDGSEYRTEQNTFARITAHGGCKYQYFIVETRDGKRIEYGKENNSRVQLSGILCPYAFYINKITDSNGNSMTYTYEQDGGDIWIKRIDYTKNEELAPYNSVEFYYDKRSDQKPYHISGVKVTPKNLLREIVIKSNDRLVRKYTFKYFKDNLDESCLNLIVESNRTGEELNSTIINWGEQNLFHVKEKVISVPTDYYAGNTERVYSSYDANGDGLSDLVTLFTYKSAQANIPKGKVIIYPAHSNSNGEITFNETDRMSYELGTVTSGFLDDYKRIPKGIVFGDLLGRGVNDMIVPVYDSDNDFHVARFTIPALNERTFDQVMDNEFPLYTLADVDNNGRTNIIYLEDKLVNGYYSGKIMEAYNEVYAFGGNVSEIDWRKTPINLVLNSEPKDIFTGDYYHDGLIDLRVATKLRIYTYLNYKGKIKYDAPANITNYDKIHGTYFKQGDFNGDGLPDLLIIGENDEQIAVAYGKGQDNDGCSLSVKYFPSISSIDDPDTNKDDDKDNCMITDFNNDGLADFIMFDAVYHWENGAWSTPWKEFKHFKVTWYASTGEGFSKIKEATTTKKDQAYNKYYVEGDFNGDGRLDLINYGFDCYSQYSPTTAWRFYNTFNTNFDANKVTAIYNGLNQKTGINYRPLSKYTDDPDFYIKGTSGISDIIKIQAPVYVVSSITQPDGAGGTGTTSYTYEGLRAHTKGKGILGFERMTSVNNITGIKQTTFNTLDDNYFSVKKLTTEVYDVNGNLMSGNIVDYDIRTYPGDPDPKRIFNHPVKVTSLDKMANTVVTKDHFNYDDYGNVLTMWEHYGSDATVRVSNTYTKAGAWCKSKLSTSKTETTYRTEDPDIKTSAYTYDTNGNLLTSSASGITITIDEYDTFGNVLQKTTSAPGTENKIETFTYDPTGRFIETATNALRQTSTCSYNDLGQRESETGIDGLTTSYAYDNWGNLETISYPNGKISTCSNGWINDGKHLFYTLDKTEGFPDLKTWYDYLGRKVRTMTKSYKGDLYTGIVYNAGGQVVETRAPHYESGGYTSTNVTTYSYYDDGRTKSVTSNGLTRTITYDKNKNKVLETFPSGKNVLTTMDATGKTTSVVNNGLNIDYNYFSNGQLKQVTAPGSSISMTYNANGFRETLNDPDAGPYSFNYDAYGQLRSKTTPLGTTYTAEYDVAGRVTRETGYGNITYSYVKSGNGINQVDKISDDQGEFMNFDYDKYGHVTQMTGRVRDLSLSVNYDYDDYGKNTAIYYPGGFGINYVYDEKSGEVKKIYTYDGKLIWELIDVNSHNQVTRYKYGNGLETFITYDTKSFIRGKATGQVQDLSYYFDADNGRFNSRTGLLTGIEETFDYDDNNQLKSITSTGKPALNLSLTYSSSVPGQIGSKSDIGTYRYNQDGSTRPHAITGLTGVKEGYNLPGQRITYTSFGKVRSIAQGADSVYFTYGPGQARKTMEVYKDNSLQRKVYYFGNYERHEAGGNVTELYYIYSATGLTAIYKRENGEPNGKMYYVHTDHLGSVQAITDEARAVQARYYYNPWGVKRNVDIATGTAFRDTNNLPWLHRGFTGHEHITEIGLINMNGRVYDPCLGMFISPDPQLQAPGNPINFNRYAYCLNNPLVYTDPSGEWVGIDDAIAFVVGGVINLGVNLWQGNIDNFGEGLMAFVAGGASGTLALYGPAGWAAGGAIVGASNSMITQMNSWDEFGDLNWGQVGLETGVGGISGLVGGYAGQLGTKLGGVAINGFNISSPVLQGTITGTLGGGMGGYAAGFTSGYLLTGDIEQAKKSGLNGMFSGAGIGAIAGFGSSYRYSKRNHINPWNGKFDKSIVIGEGMYDRVDPAALDLKAETISSDWPSNLDSYVGKDMPNGIGLEFNANWIQYKVEMGYHIYDLGPRGSTISSPYYNLEVGRTINYSNLHNTYKINNSFGLSIYWWGN